MHLKLRQLFLEIENQRKETLNSVVGFTQSQLNQPLIPGKWSAAQILNHLITAEQLSLRYMQKKFLGIKDTTDSGMLEEIKINLLILSQRLPGIKFKAPKAVMEQMMQLNDLNSIATEWNKVREELALLLEKIPDDLVNRKIYRHAIAGYLSVKHSLIFFREHITHHGVQLRKLTVTK